MFLPADAKKMENTLRNIGLGSEVDKAILQINRAAGDAVGYGKPIFVNAIKEMTIQDALSLVKGSPSAATDYFRAKTRTQLIAAFSPSIKTSLDKVEATKYYGDLVNTYNKIPTTIKKINPDLPSYVAEKATDALFDQIQKEEANIRANPAARTSEILKKVFGNVIRVQWSKGPKVQREQPVGILRVNFITRVGCCLCPFGPLALWPFC